MKTGTAVTVTFGARSRVIGSGESSSAARLRVVVTLAALPEGDDLSFTRLQDILGLTPGNLITHLRKLEDAGYVQMVKAAKETSVSLTRDGRAALQRYTVTLRRLLDAADQTQPQ